MNKKILIAGSILGLIAIVLGAFGAHALKALISTEMQQTFETGVRYQMYHALFLLCVGGFFDLKKKPKHLILYFVVFGILCFSGSLYLLATNELTAYNFNSIGFITPIGGLLLIIAWFILLIKILNLKSDIS